VLREAVESEPIRSAAQLQAAYVGAFDLYVTEPSEAALHLAYELGRRAVELGVSVPEIARIHHRALRVVLQAPVVFNEEVVISRGADFLAECLSAFEMIRRGYSEAHQHAQLERRHAAVLRRLSMLLADQSLAWDRTKSLAETLQLVAEAARELTGARWCSATVNSSGAHAEPVMVQSGEEPTPGEKGHELIADLMELSGRPLGSLRLFGDSDRDFREQDRAVVNQLAQMAAATVERTRLYR
jgi:hypothetical protein